VVKTSSVLGQKMLKAGAILDAYNNNP
jgi:hypothetical protein